ADERRPRSQRLVVVPSLEVERPVVGECGPHTEVLVVVDEVPGERGAEAPRLRLLPAVLLGLRPCGRGRQQRHREHDQRGTRQPHPPRAVTTATSTAPMPSIARPIPTGPTPQQRPSLCPPAKSSARARPRETIFASCTSEVTRNGTATGTVAATTRRNTASAPSRSCSWTRAGAWRPGWAATVLRTASRP